MFIKVLQNLGILHPRPDGETRVDPSLTEEAKLTELKTKHRHHLLDLKRESMTNSIYATTPTKL